MNNQFRRPSTRNPILFLNIGKFRRAAWASFVALLLVVGVVIAAAGDLDPTFGAPNGFVTTNVTGDDDEDPVMVIQSDGKIVIAGQCDEPSDIFCLVRYNPDGSLDTTGFGAPNGYVTTDIPGNEDKISGVALQTDGKIVVAGFCDNSESFCVARYNTDGSLDTAGFGAPNGYIVSDLTAGEDQGHGVAIQADGKIVVAGDCADEDTFCVARYNADGTLDTAGLNNPNGYGIYDVTPNHDFDPDVAIQADGKIVVGGSCNDSQFFCVIRLNTDGPPDNTFGCATPPCTGAITHTITNNSDLAKSVAIQGDGKILLAGECNAFADDRFCVARYNSNGTLDTTGFGTPNGFVVSDFTPDDDEVRDMVLQGDGKIILAGECNDPNLFCLARYNPDGSLDTTFGAPNGFVTTDITNDDDEGQSVAIQADGKIVVAGECNDDDFFCVARYQNDPASGVDPPEEGCHFLTGISGGNYRCGDMFLKIPAYAVSPGNQANLDQCPLSILDIRGGDSDGNSLLDDLFFDVDITCDNAPVRNFDVPLMACIRPADRSTSGKFVFHRHDGASSFSALGQVSGPAGYVCGSTRQLSLFVLGETEIPETGFAPGVVTVINEQPMDKVYFELASADMGLTYREVHPTSAHLNDFRLEIPSLGVELPIVGVPLTEQGWNVTWLGQQAGYLEGTAFPTWVGNTAITAHVWDADNTPGPFVDLHTLQHGDQFSIHAYEQVYTYEVRESLLVQPNKLSVFEHSDYDTVTLLTCESWSVETEVYQYRRAVRAVLVNVEAK